MSVAAPAPPVAQPTMPPCAHTPTPYAGPSREEVLRLRHQYLNPALFMLYR